MEGAAPASMARQGAGCYTKAPVRSPTPQKMHAMPSQSPPLPSPPHHLQPLAQWPAAARSALVGVFTDIDDTLTHEGAITPDALQALGDLKAAGLSVVAITGRPVGWSLPFVNTWPIDAIVAENGAVALLPAPHARMQRASFRKSETPHKFARICVPS